MCNARFVQRLDGRHKYLGPRNMPRPDGRILRRSYFGSAMFFCLTVEDLLQVVAVLNKLKRLEIAGSAPNLLESIKLRHRESRCGTISHTRRKLTLIRNKRMYQTTVGAGDLYCLKKTGPPAGERAAYEIAIMPGPKTLVMR